jgi:hypothetical protein
MPDSQAVNLQRRNRLVNALMALIAGFMVRACPTPGGVCGNRDTARQWLTKVGAPISITRPPGCLALGQDEAMAS